jgi:TfoX/Sxy family transcriptional regulator of competence genes
MTRTTEATIETLLQRIAPAGNVRARKMFGEYALYCDEKVVALVCRDELFVKLTEAGRDFAPDVELAPAYDGAKPGLHILRAAWTDPEWLPRLIRITADALPAKTKK